MVKYGFFQILSKTNERVFKNFMKVLGTYSLTYVIVAILSGLLIFIFGGEAILTLIRHKVNDSSIMSIIGTLALLFLILFIINIIVYFFFKVFLYRLYYRNDAKKGMVKVGDIFKLCCVYFLFSIIISILYMLIFFPGLIFSVFWAFWMVLYINEKKGFFESLKISKKIVNGNWFRVFFYYLFAIIIFIIIFMITYILLKLIFTPLLNISNNVIGILFSILYTYLAGFVILLFWAYMTSFNVSFFFALKEEKGYGKKK